MMEPQKLSCPQMDQLASFVAGRLKPETTDRIAEHVETCSECQTRVEELDRGEFSVDQLADRETSYRYADESKCKQVVDAIAAGASVATGIDASDPVRGHPESLGGYTLLEGLGQGGMGKVFRARHLALDTIAAIKLLQPRRKEDASAIDRFQREMVALGRLDHPNIVRALDAGEEGGRHFLVMEYIDGIDLAELCAKKGRLSVADAAELARQTAVGLTYVHAHGRIHRDIKPSNLMLTHDATLKLLDLGLARIEEYTVDEVFLGGDDILGSSMAELTHAHQVMGTVEYMAPEQAVDSRSVDFRADLYSLGCTLYKLLVGRSPLACSQSVAALPQLIAQIGQPITPITDHREDVPAGLAELIHELVEKDPNKRPASAADVAERLAPFAAAHKLQTLLTATTSVESPAMRDTVVGARSTDQDGTRTTAKQAVANAGRARGAMPWVATIVAAAALLVPGILALKSRLIPDPKGLVLVQSTSPAADGKLKGNDVRLLGPGGPHRLVSGEMELAEGVYRIDAAPGLELDFSPQEFEVTPDRRMLLTVSLREKQPAGALETIIPKRTTPDRGSITVVPKVAPPPVEPPPVEPDPIPTLPSVDLISLVDPARDIRGRDWELKDHSLVSKSGSPAVMMFPYEPPDEYILEMTARRREGSEAIHLGVVAAGKSFLFSIDSGRIRTPVSGFRTLSGQPVNKRSDGVARGEVFPVGQSVPIALHIKRVGGLLTAQLDVSGTQMLFWRGLISRIGVSSTDYPAPQSNVLLLTTWSDSFEVADYRVTPIEKPGRIIEFADPETDPQLAAAQRVIWKGGEVHVADETGISKENSRRPIGGFHLQGMLEGHSGMVNDVEIDPTRNEVATCSGHTVSDQSIRIWNLETRKTRLEIKPGFDVLGIAYAPDGNSLYSTGHASKVSVWDTKTGALVRELKIPAKSQYRHIVLTPDARHLVVLSDPVQSNAGRRGKLYVFDLQSNKIIQHLDLPESRGFAMTPDGTELVTGRADSSVEVIRWLTGERTQVFKGPPFAVVKSRHLDDPYCFAVSRDGRMIAAGYKQNRIRIWDRISGKAVRDLYAPNFGNERILFTPNGQFLIATGVEGCSALFDIESSEVVATSERLVGNGWAAALSPSSPMLLTGGGVSFVQGWEPTDDYAVRIWDLSDAIENFNRPSEPRKRYSLPITRLADLPEHTIVREINWKGSLWASDQDGELIQNLPELRRINYDGTSITADTIDHFRNLPELSELSFANTEIDRWSDSFLELPSLEALDLSGTKIQDLKEARLDELSQLKRLDLHGLPLDREAFKKIAALEKLQSLDLRDTEAESSDLHHLSGLSSLSELRLAGTRVASLEGIKPSNHPRLNKIEFYNTDVPETEYRRLQSDFPDANLLSNFGPLDLLPLIDPERDLFFRSAVAVGSFLEIEGETMISIPIHLPPQFELEVHLQKLQGSAAPRFNLPLPDGTNIQVAVDHHQFPDGRSSVALFGLDKTQYVARATAKPGLFIAIDGQETSRVRVRVEEGDSNKIELSVAIDDQPVLSWSGDRSRLIAEAEIEQRDRFRPTIGPHGDDSILRFSEIKLTPISGSIGFAPFDPKQEHTTDSELTAGESER